MNTHKAKRINWVALTYVVLIAAGLFLGGILFERHRAPTPDPEIVEIPAVLEDISLLEAFNDVLAEQRAVDEAQAAVDAKYAVIFEFAAMLQAEEDESAAVLAPTPHTTAPPPSITTTTTMTAPAEAQTD